MSFKLAADNYIQRGWAPTPARPFGKEAMLPRWPDRRITTDSVAEYFRPLAEQNNIAIVLGTMSGGLVDVDIDSLEALAIADDHLPHTDSVFGRASKLRSHRLYQVEGVPLRCAYRMDPTEAGVGRSPTAEMIVELRGERCATIFPPSIHSSRELVSWHNDGAPSKVTLETLQASVQSLANAVRARHGQSPLPAAGSMSHRTPNAGGGFFPDDATGFPHIRRILDALHITTPGSSWTARCPAHPDGTPSLSVSVGTDARVLLYCHAGCDFDDIVAALNLQQRELFLPSATLLRPLSLIGTIAKWEAVQ